MATAVPTEIKLAEEIGDRCLTKDQGERALALIRAALAADGHVHLNFSGVRTLISLFLNNAVGPLFEEFDRAEFDRRVSVEGLTENQATTFEHMLRNAEAYHRDTDYRRALEAALLRRFEEIEHR